jgi:hypothetical protein
MADNLILNDGTETDVKVDSEFQKSPIDVNGQPDLFGFQQSNISQIEQQYNNIADKIDIVKRTLIPLVDKAFIELIGNNKAAQKQVFNVTIGENGLLDVQLVYLVQEFIVQDIQPQYVQSDETYIRNTLSVMKNVTFRTIKIDTTSGKVIIQCTM